MAGIGEGASRGMMSGTQASSRRAALMLGSAMAGALALAAPGTAAAQAECGAPAANGSVTCTPAGNPYGNGITYVGAVQDLTVALADNTTVTRTPAFQTPSLNLSTIGGNLTVTSGANTSISSIATRQSGANLVATGNINAALPSIRTAGDSALGVYAYSSGGNVNLSTRDITTAGAFAPGILAFTNAGTITINAGGAINATGNGSAGITTVSDGAATITAQSINAAARGVSATATNGVAVTVNGNVSSGRTGIFAYSAGGPSSVTVTGAINTPTGSGVYAYAGRGNATVTVGGPVTARNTTAYGLIAVAPTGTATVTANGAISTVSTNGGGAGIIAQGVDAIINATGGVTASGQNAFGALGFGTRSATVNGNIAASNGASALSLTAPVINGTANGAITTGDTSFAAVNLVGSTNATLTVTGGIRGVGRGVAVGSGTTQINADITSTGNNRAGVVDFFSNGGALTLQTKGNITTQGNGSYGIQVVNSRSATISATGGTISTAGTFADAIHAITRNGLSITADSLQTKGQVAYGVFAVDYTPAGNPQDLTNVLAVNVGSVATGGNGANGIFARGNNTVQVNAGSVVTLGDGATGIRVTPGTSYGTALSPQVVAINLTNGSTAGANANLVQATGSSAVSVTSTGTLSVSGPYSTAVVAQSPTGNVSFAINNASVSGNGSNLVRAFGSNVSGTISGTVSGNAAQYYANTPTVLIGATNTAALTHNGAITLTGANEAAISATAGSKVLISGTGSVVTSGANAAGVLAQSVDYALVNLGSVGTTGAGSNAVTVRGGGTAIGAVGTVSATGAGSSGLTVQGYNAAVAQVGNASTSGAGATTISAASYGLTQVKATGTVAATGAGSTAVLAQGGDVTVALNNLNVAGNGTQGVSVLAARDATVTLSGAGTGSANVAARPATPIPGGRTSDTSTGIIDVTAGRNATVTLAGTIATSGANEGGITVRSAGQSVINGGGAITTTGAGATGAYAGSTGTLSSVTLGNVSTAGNGAWGVISRSFGTANASAANVTTTGDDARGVSAVGALASNVVVSGNLNTSGARAIGVESQSYGIATATLGNVTTKGDGATGVFVYGRDGGAIVKTGNVQVGNAGGIFAGSANGPVTITAGNVSAAGNGNASAIYAFAGTSANVTFGNVTQASNTASTFAGQRTAVLVLGNSSSTVKGGSIATTGPDLGGIGVVADAGPVSINLTGPITTTGNNSPGIIALAYGGSASVTANGVSTTGSNSGGIFASGTSVAVTSNGPITVTGAAGASRYGKAGVVANASAGNAVLQLGTVNASGAGLDAVDVQATGNTTLTIASGGTVAGNVNAVAIRSGGTTTVNNAGTITGGSNAALLIAGGKVTVTNSGTITGAVVLGDAGNTITNNGTLTLTSASTGAGNDLLTNNGLLQLAGNVDFGLGTDALVNNGTLRFASGTGAQARTLSRLETFTNTGLIDLRSGIAGDTLTTSGAFVGSGNSTLALDVNFSTATADRLVVGGAATGSTAIVVNPVVAGNAGLVSGITLVQTGASSPGAFSLASGSQTAGFIQYGLVMNAGATNFSLVGVPAAAAYRAAKISEGAQTIARSSMDAVSAHFANLRDDPQVSSGLWMIARGGTTRRQEGRTYTTYGFTQAADLTYPQDDFGEQIGLDLGSGGIRFGITGGYDSSVMNFVGPDRATLEALNGGVYASFLVGPFFVGAQGHYTDYKVRAQLRSIGAADRFGGHTWSGKAEAGLRLGGDAFYAEPIVAVSYLDTKLDPLTAYGAQIDYYDGEGLFGEAGLRIGSVSDIGAGAKLTVYASGTAVKSFHAANSVDFITGANSVNIDTARLPTFAVAKGGFSIGQGRVSGFMEGSALIGDHYRGGGARVGLRIGF